MKSFVFTCILTGLFVWYSKGQDHAARQINNMILPDNYKISNPGELGGVVKRGKGQREIILIAGWGFGTDLFNDFMQRNRNNYNMYAVTLPGFDNTPAPSIPEEGTSYGKQIWTKNAIDGIVNLIKKSELDKPVVIGHFITSTQIALRLAIDHHDLIGGVVIAGGSAKVVNPQLENPPTLEERIKINDTYYGPKWFKTISKADWDNGNYPPITFSKDSVIAKKLWNKSASVLLPVMIQYLLEFYASDLSLEFDKIKVPALIMIPTFNPDVIKNYSYLRYNFQDSWKNAENVNNLIQVDHIENSHLFIMKDRPEYFDKAIKIFSDDI